MKAIVAIGNLACILSLWGVFSTVEAQPPAPSEKQTPSQSLEREYRISDAMLREFVADQNKDLPLTFSEAMRWDSTSLGSGRTLIYRFTILDPNFNTNDAQKMEQLKTLTVQTFCEQDWIGLFLDDAVIFDFQYRHSRGDLLTEVRLDRQSCR
jgi:hypothetical protein